MRHLPSISVPLSTNSAVVPPDVFDLDACLDVLARHLMESFRRRCTALRRWLDRAKSCEVQALQTFAAGLQQDLTSIEAAPTTGWSNGQTEGHIDKLKLLKRQM